MAHSAHGHSIEGKSVVNQPIRIIGVHPIEASEPCYLIEIELHDSTDDFDFGSITQVVPELPEQNWQVAYDEQPLGDDEEQARWVFFFHHLDLRRPLLTQYGELVIPSPTPVPSHLEEIEYFEP